MYFIEILPAKKSLASLSNSVFTIIQWASLKSVGIPSGPGEVPLFIEKTVDFNSSSSRRLVNQRFVLSVTILGYHGIVFGGQYLGVAGKKIL